MTGLFGKYKIEKSDGSPIDPKAQYFVLRLDTDKAARAAMVTYARNCHDTGLFRDIIGWVLSIDPDYFSHPGGDCLMAFEKEILRGQVSQ